MMKKIGKAAKRAGIFLLCLAAAAFLMEAASPETEEAGSSTEETHVENADAGTSSGSDRKDVLYSKKGLAAWISEKLSEEDPDITEEEIELWGQAGEKEFRSVWKKAVLKQIKGWEETEDYQKTADDIKRACTIYKKVCGSDKALKNIRQNADTVSDTMKENKALGDGWGIDMHSEADKCMIETMYIAKKLETSYSDNLAGKLQKGADSCIEEDYSDWLAYDVEYIMDQPHRGDTCRMVVRTDKDDPFSQSGAYRLAYLDTGETTTLADGSGFEQKVPVCRKIGDGDAVQGDIARYESNIDVCFSLCQDMEQEIKTGQSQSSRTDAVEDVDSVDAKSMDIDPADDGRQDYIFSDSSERYLDDWELELCSSEELSLARNEIYARHGRRFNDKAIQEYFDSMPWYEGTVKPEDFDDAVFNEYEKANLNKLAMYE